MVELLVEAGANLGGSDLGGGFAQLEVEKAQASANAHALQIWARVGLRPRDA